MRRARVKVDGEAYYHVMSRCALQKYLLGGAEVKEMFLKILGRAERFSGVEVGNYCVMDNHFHLLVKVPGREEVDDASKYVWGGYGAACAGDRRARAALLSTSLGDAGADEKWEAYVSRLEMEAVDGGEAAAPVGGDERQAPGHGGAVVRIKLREMRLKDRNISRGMAFGSKDFVKARIGEYSRTGKAGTKPVMFGTGERSTPLFCTGRRSA